MRRAIVLLSASLITLSTAGFAAAQNATQRNLILFIPDGLRGKIVTPQTAPAMAELRDKGVNFKNSHSLFPTFTMANGSAMASGHYLGDTGDLLQHDLHRQARCHANGTVTPVHRGRSRAEGSRRDVRRRLSQRRNHLEDGARQGF